MKIVWSRRAIRHLIALRDYIAEDSPQNSAVVAERILKSVELLATHPHIGRPGRIVGTRELVIPNAPYIIPYRIRGERPGTHCRLSWAAEVAGKADTLVTELAEAGWAGAL